MATLFEQNPYTQQQNFYAPDSAAQGSTSGSQSHLQFYSSGTGGDASAYNYGGSAGELEGTLGDCSDGPSGQIQGGLSD